MRTLQHTVMYVICMCVLPPRPDLIVPLVLFVFFDVDDAVVGFGVCGTVDGRCCRGGVANVIAVVCDSGICCFDVVSVSISTSARSLCCGVGCCCCASVCFVSSSASTFFVWLSFLHFLTISFASFLHRFNTAVVLYHSCNYTCSNHATLMKNLLICPSIVIAFCLLIFCLTL